MAFNISINGEEFVIFVLLNQDKHPYHVRSTGQRYNGRLRFSPGFIKQVSQDTLLNGAWDTKICFVGCLFTLYLPFSMANSLTNRRERIKRCLAKWRVLGAEAMIIAFSLLSSRNDSQV